MLVGVDGEEERKEGKREGSSFAVHCVALIHAQMSAQPAILTLVFSVFGAQLISLSLVCTYVVRGTSFAMYSRAHSVLFFWTVCLVCFKTIFRFTFSVQWGLGTLSLFFLHMLLLKCTSLQATSICRFFYSSPTLAIKNCSISVLSSFHHFSPAGIFSELRLLNRDPGRNLKMRSHGRTLSAGQTLVPDHKA